MPVNKTGQVVIEPQFDTANSFGDGLALVRNSKDNHKGAYINKTGKIVIKPQFDGAKDFSEGVASAEIGGRWGFIDKTGNFIK
ncbi:MAG: WG repeat-containing protein [Planctomycetes bacterium]|nr:WG repeat-containing protein [Planctomycetota bacterium]